MDILGFRITKIKKHIPNSKMVERDRFLIHCIQQCNNQLRGFTNDKTKAYNEDIINYWALQISNAGIELGQYLEEQRQLNKKINGE